MSLRIIGYPGPEPERQPIDWGGLFPLLLMLVFLVATLVAGGIIFYSAHQNKLTSRRYCGPVVRGFQTEAAYKVAPRAYVVIHSDSLQRNISVQVTWNTYANSTPGSIQCFRLTNEDLIK